MTTPVLIIILLLFLLLIYGGYGRTRVAWGWPGDVVFTVLLIVVVVLIMRQLRLV